MTDAFQKVHALTGMKDILPDASGAWEELEEVVRRWLASYGYLNMRTPVLEHTRLFARGIGEVTDIVEKEMYSFTDPLSDEHLTLRPEFTAGMVRATIEHNILYDGPRRVYALGPVFRREKPQRGRYRQFHQIDVEALGFPGPDVDAELIIMLARLWKILGLSDIRLELNSLGQAHEREAHRTALIAHLEAHTELLDEDARRRMYTNPLRVLDTKNPALQDMADAAPRLFDFLGEESRAHFDGVCALLADAGIAYRFNPRLVRGLDYYNLTVFEWVTDRLGAQGTVCGGGRYDGLIALLGGRSAPAVGFAIGIERLLDLWAQAGERKMRPQCEIYIVHQSQEGHRLAFKVAEQLRDAGFNVMVHAGAAGFKAQFRRADASGAGVAVILGSDEAASGSAGIKSLRSEPVAGQAQQQTVPLDRLVDELKGEVGCMAYDLEEQEKLDALRAWWDRYGTLISALVLAAVVAFAGWRGWQWYENHQAAQAMGYFEALEDAARQDGDEGLAQGKPASATLRKDFADSGYSSRGALIAAEALQRHGDRDAAREQLRWLIDDSPDRALAPVASLRLAGILLTEKKYDEALALLGNPPAEFAGLYADRRGDILYAQGKPAEARKAWETALGQADAQALAPIVQLKIDALGA